MAQVTSEDFAERLLRAAKQANAVRRGEAEPARVSRRRVLPPVQPGRSGGEAPP